MYDISNLTPAELETICKIITGIEFKKLFKRKPTEFTKIKKGFRPNSISETDAINIAIKHNDRPFISSFIKHFIENNLETIQGHIEYYKYLGMDKNMAIAKALSRSVFSENPEIYFKLINKDFDAAVLKRCLETVEQDEDDSANTEVIESDDDKNNETYGNETLKNKLKDCYEHMEKTEALHESQLKDLQAEIDHLKAELQDSQREYQSLKRKYDEDEVELVDLRARAHFDDSEEFVEESENGTKYDYCSLCEVDYPDDQGHKNAIRLADIINGRLEAFHVDENKPKIYENRYKIFYKEGPTERGEIGIWRWYAVQNKADQSRDYVFTSFDSVASPIEVIIVSDCNSAEELLEKIKNGVEAVQNTSRILFAVYRSKNLYTGFLCKSKDVEQKGKVIRISRRVVSLPRYEFTGKDITHLSNGKSYYRSLRIGMPYEVVNVKNPLDIVRTIILSRSSWSLFKERGKTRSEWKNIIDLLERMDNQSIIDSIVKEAYCSKKEAQKMLNDFIENASNYVSGTTVEDQIIAAVVSVNTELMGRCKTLIMDDWQEENRTAIDAANAELEEIQKREKDLNKQYLDDQKKLQKQKEEAESDLKAIMNEQDSLLDKLQELSDEIESKEKLASDVEDAVKNRIRQAQSEAAEFIAGLSFAPRMVIERPESIEMYQGNAVSESADNKSYYIAGQAVTKENLEVNDSWNDAINTIADELQEAGVIDKYSLHLAAYLYSAYLLKTPLLLIGPNANAIVDAFSASLFGRTAGVLDCRDMYSGKAIEICLSSEDRVIRIVNPFSNNWVSRIPDMVSNRDKFFVAVYPFMEDLQIEPKSLFSHILPVFTEMVIDKVPTGHVIGGVLSEKYKEFKPQSNKRRHEKILSDMHTSLLVRTRIQTILNCMHEMLNDQAEDYDILFSLVPYAYVTMQMHTLVDAIQNGNAVSKETAALIRGLFGDNE